MMINRVGPKAGRSNSTVPLLQARSGLHGERERDITSRLKHSNTQKGDTNEHSYIPYRCGSDRLGGD